MKKQMELTIVELSCVQYLVSEIKRIDTERQELDKKIAKAQVEIAANHSLPADAFTTTHQIMNGVIVEVENKPVAVSPDDEADFVAAAV